MAYGKGASHGTDLANANTSSLQRSDDRRHYSSERSMLLVQTSPASKRKIENAPAGVDFRMQARSAAKFLLTGFVCSLALVKRVHQNI